MESALAAAEKVLAPLPELSPDVEEMYKDLHRHPELGFQEFRTAGIAAESLRACGYEVHEGVGGTGVVGLLRNGEGPVVLLRADMDGLPVAEDSGLEYAATDATGLRDGRQVPVMHACGHDVHVACLVGAARLLARAREHWSGTVVALFQPAEELGTGARAMLADGLFDRVPRPDAVLAQHVSPLAAGHTAYCPGVCMAASDEVRITFHGVGGHGSRPEAANDPVLTAAAFVQRVQMIVSREIATGERAVLTVGSITAGEAANVIPDTAEVALSVRSFTPSVRTRVLASIERIARAESDAAGAPRHPDVRHSSGFPVSRNDDALTDRVNAALRDRLGEDKVHEIGPITGSEDVQHLADAAGAPLYYWWVGGWESEEFLRAYRAGTADRDIPANHSPRFAPVLRPTLGTGVTTMTVAALSCLAAGG
ncbi:amidohydrolase [Nocardiopsis sp. YSL2]|uniref:amidohydrolase n=1 Tax=Nocardiopsis sp. YSL2 TaxID=2939492 RepID=UPI0026F41092|nr:amidohydrolase [Nocardiopsis sp. YSL2]